MGGRSHHYLGAPPNCDNCVYVLTHRAPPLVRSSRPSTYARRKICCESLWCKMARHLARVRRTDRWIARDASRPDAIGVTARCAACENDQAHLLGLVRSYGRTGDEPMGLGCRHGPYARSRL